MKVKSKGKKSGSKAAKKKPAPAGKRGNAKSAGRSSGLGVSEFWSSLFAANAAAKKKMTDKQIAAAVKAEFPGRKIVQPVGRVRSFYNRGAQGYGNPPGTNVRGTKKESFAYDSKGNVTRSSAWGFDKKPNKKLSAVAKKRALKAWAAKKKAVSSKKKKGVKIKKKAA